VIERLVAAVTTQLSVPVWSPISFAGVAVKLRMASRLCGATVTTTVAVRDPKMLVAVRV